MRFRTTIKIVPLDGTGEPAAFGLTDDIHDVTISKLIDQDLVAHVRALIRLDQPKFLQYSCWWNSAPGFFEMAAAFDFAA